MMTQHGTLSAPRFSRPTFGGRLGGGSASGPGTLARAALERIYLWQSRYEDRRALADLEPRLLRDIGLDRRTAEEEAAKPFWRP